MLVGHPQKVPTYQAPGAKTPGRETNQAAAEAGQMQKDDPPSAFGEYSTARAARRRREAGAGAPSGERTPAPRAGPHARAAPSAATMRSVTRSHEALEVSQGRAGSARALSMARARRSSKAGRAAGSGSSTDTRVGSPT